MGSINRLRKFNKLKQVERNIPIGSRKESPAEHSWSALILADYFLDHMSEKLDRLKVYELLMYHDVVEIRTGDTCISKQKERENKKEREMIAASELKEEFPDLLGKKFFSLFMEFEEQKSREAKFAKAIDQLEPEIHLLDYKEEWTGWTEDFIRKVKEPLMNEFPEIKEAFEKVTIYAREQGYFK